MREVIALQAVPVLDCANRHGEGILWNPADRRVWWTDIHGQGLWWFRPDDGLSGRIALPGRLCAFAPRAGGGWIMAFADAVELWSADFRCESRIHAFEPGNPHTRLNDGRTDRDGRFVVGGMNEGTGAFDSSVIRVNADRSVEVLFGGVSCANSICFSPDGATMFFADSPRRRIEAIAYSDLAMRRVLVEMPGIPDGSCIDAEGGLWNAVWEGAAVMRFDAQGRATHRIDLPVRRATCCAFGGDDLATLYITTSQLGADAAERAATPLAGGLFAARPGHTGLADHPFAG